MIAVVVCGLCLLVMIVAMWIFPRKFYVLSKKMGGALCGLEEKSVEVQGLHFSYLVGGHGTPLVLLHGFAGGKEHWLLFAKYLVKDFQVIIPDLPGYGSSSSDLHLDYSITAQARRLSLFTQELGLAQFHLVGNSMGGAIAAVFAASYPEILLSLCLMDPAGVSSASPSERELLLAKGENILLVRNFAEYKRTYRFCFHRPPYIPTFVLRTLYEDSATKAALYNKMYQDMMDCPLALESIAAEIRVPVLVLWGDKDRSTDVSGARVLQSVLSHAQVTVLKNIGHMPMIENPGLTVRTYWEFQKNVG